MYFLVEIPHEIPQLIIKSESISETIKSTYLPNEEVIFVLMPYEFGQTS